jgi:hypothetical protein
MGGATVELLSLMSIRRSLVFVQWKRQSFGRRCKASPSKERVLYAALFENQSVGGRMRQRMVRCLATIRGGLLVYPTSLTGFWRDVDCTLTDLRLDDDERRRLETSIAAALPRPDPSGVEQQMEAGALTMAIAAMCARRGKRRHSTAGTVAMEASDPPWYGT